MFVSLHLFCGEAGFSSVVTTMCDDAQVESGDALCTPEINCSVLSSGGWQTTERLMKVKASFGKLRLSWLCPVTRPESVKISDDEAKAFHFEMKSDSC